MIAYSFLEPRWRKWREFVVPWKFMQIARAS
jgi:hypothetical protein